MTTTHPQDNTKPPLGFVAIGRNEGARLTACLQSLIGANAGPVIYVDSGSSDDSVAQAKSLGASVVELDMSIPFTAARARNAGYQALKAHMREAGGVEFVQFVDGDCTLVEGWTEAARDFLSAHEKTAAVCGRVRERFPDASIFNLICDIEWAAPAGETEACGGNAMFRAAAFDAVDGFSQTLLAGEEPELCLRLRERGWKIFRLDHDMVLHDAAMTTLNQYWRRSTRTGHAFAEVSNRHANSPRRIWRRETLRALFWAGLAPLAILAAIFVHPAALGVLAIYPLQIARIARRQKTLRSLAAWQYAGLITLAKFAEAQGVVTYWLSRLRGRRTMLIEYKA